jgi:hypothetical protein
MRRAITPHERLSVTLRFLATGRNCEDLKFCAAISPHAPGVVIPETCRGTKRRTLYGINVLIRVYQYKNIKEN